MEIFQTIWTFLITPNDWFVPVLAIPMAIFEALLSMLLFLTVLNITSSRKQRLIYVVSISAIGIITNFLIPVPFNRFINIIFIPILVHFIFKANIVKSIFAEVIPLVVMVILDNLFAKIYFVIFGLDYTAIASIPIYRMSIVIVMYLAVFGVYLLVKKFNININILEDMSKKSKRLIVINAILGSGIIAIQIYLNAFYTDKLPFLITLLSIVSIFLYFIISLYSVSGITKLEIANRDLEQSEKYNKTLNLLHDNIRAFKHDFSNIVQTIGRLCCYFRYGRIKEILFSIVRRLPEF